MAESKRWLFQPLDKMIKTQSFGENRACIDIATGTKTITCNGLFPPTGYKSIYSNMPGHNGLDLDTWTGQPVYASQDGVITEYVAEDARGLGLGMQTERKHWCQETGKQEYFKIRYWHNLVHFVKKGDKVKVGQLIALSDNTGYSSGDHLHFEVKPVTKSRRNRLQKNGYFGAVDPEQYMLPVKASKFGKAKTLKERALIILLMWLNK